MLSLTDVFTFSLLHIDDATIVSRCNKRAQTQRYLQSIPGAQTGATSLFSSRPFFFFPFMLSAFSS